MKYFDDYLKDLKSEMLFYAKNKFPLLSNEKLWVIENVINIVKYKSFKLYALVGAYAVFATILL